jgi:hypothetical protein
VPLLAARRGKYRNVYLAGKDGIRLKTRELLHEKPDGTHSTWLLFDLGLLPKRRAIAGRIVGKPEVIRGANWVGTHLN